MIVIDDAENPYKFLRKLQTANCKETDQGAFDPSNIPYNLLFIINLFKTKVDKDRSKLEVIFQTKKSDNEVTYRIIMNKFEDMIDLLRAITLFKSEKKDLVGKDGFKAKMKDTTVDKWEFKEIEPIDDTDLQK